MYISINMRPLNDRSRRLKTGCVICKRHSCIDEKVPNIRCRINNNSARITRSVTKLMKAMNNFIILELYRCMPLLGNEKEIVPTWEVHIVHYAVVLVDKS